MRNIKSLTWPMNRRVMALMIGAVWLPLIYIAQQPNSVAQPTETVVNYYENACQIQARETFNVPPLTVDQSQGLIGWQRENLGTAEGRAFNAALADCAPSPRFDFENLILVHSEISR